MVERTAHNRVVVGSSPTGPIEVRRKMVGQQRLGDEAGGIALIEWEDNEGGPDERMIEESHPFYGVIVDEAHDDPDATVKRL